jgi:ubiquinone/menaquinone biosynthesis C-methylase UbiE
VLSIGFLLSAAARYFRGRWRQERHGGDALSDATITNIDLNAEYADAPCNQLPNVTFLCADATALPFEDNSFDAITMFDLLEHVPDDAKAIAEAKRVLRPGGYLLVSTPHQLALSILQSVETDLSA